MTLFDCPLSRTKNSLKKIINQTNPEDKDPFAFNFVKRNDYKQKKDLFKALHSTSFVCSHHQKKMMEEKKKEQKVVT